MPNATPPKLYDGTPNRYQLRRGTCLWRVHRRGQRPWAFNPCPAEMVFGGGRFDATCADKYPYYYAGLQDTTALAESLLRDLKPNDYGTRALPREAIRGRCIAGLTLTRDLTLVSLVNGPDLAAIGQDSWLVNATDHEYAQTRAWGHWLRRQAEWAHGFIWSSLRDRGGMAIVLFGDRCESAFGADYQESILHHVPSLTVSLGGRAGAEWLTERLEPYRVAVASPRAGLHPMPAR